jgi:hypothetical protein
VSPPPPAVPAPVETPPERYAKLVERRDGGDAIRWRVGGREYLLRVVGGADAALFGDGVLEVDVEVERGRPLAVRVAGTAEPGHALVLTKEDAEGRLKLTVTLPDAATLDGLAAAVGRLPGG